MKIKKQWHEMCKIKVQEAFFCNNIWKTWNEVNKAIWCKMIFQINVEQTKGNGGLAFMYTLLKPSSKKVPWKFIYVRYPKNHLQNLHESWANFHVIGKKMDSGEWIPSIKWKLSIMDEKWVMVMLANVGVHDKNYLGLIGVFDSLGWSL